jgi:hypothetical protein
MTIRDSRSDSDRISLNGTWLLRPDPGDQGERDGWWKSAWPTQSASMEVPDAYQRVLGAAYHGVAWLTRSVRLPSDWSGGANRRLWLRFEHVSTDATVWVNGVRVGRHVGDYVPFQFDVTDAANQGWQGKAPAKPASDRELIVCVRVDEMPAPRPPPGVTVESGHITKGFHDVLSLHHGGIWGGVSLRQTGPLAIRPDGVHVRADASTGEVVIHVELEPHDSTGRISVEADVPGLAGACTAEAPVGRGTCIVDIRCTDPATTPARPWNPELWSPERPTLGRVAVRIHGEDPASACDSETVRFGFRTVRTGGPGNRSILLNGKPIMIRGVLHWGHEPERMAPAPTPEQTRAEFARLREMGFNCVCLCMWYPPTHYFDIADETGMLLWQEHPVWKSPMEEELIPEYRAMFERFFRRDRRHPSVVVVSGSCEHERIHPDLAAWWWKRAKEELPDRLVQVQTAFTAWVNPDQVDMHDEHVYESSGRWVKFCEDLKEALSELPERPFVMGETIIGTSWIDAAAVRKAIGSTSERPWWTPKGLDECEAFERKIEARYGSGTLARFKGGADRLNLEMRKFQSEVFRMDPRNAGWVMNQIRDVAQGRLGFMDDMGHWRFSPEQTRPWLNETIALLRTPDQRRGFCGGSPIPVQVGVSNYGDEPFEGPIDLRIASSGHEADIASPSIHCQIGDVARVDSAIPLPAVSRPTRLNVRAMAAGVWPNGWDLWAFPSIDEVPPDVVRLDGLPYSRRDLEPQFEERAYSSGWGLKVRTWKAVFPYPETVLFKAPLWRFDGPLPPATRVVVAHKLTNRLVEFMEGGGRVLLLTSVTPGGLGTRFLNVWGQVPLVPEEGPLGPGDGEWIADLLHHDLTRRYTRAIPVDELGIADQVDPLVRLVFTHDRGAPKLLDSAFMARVGSGALLATSLDHTEDPGRFLLQKFLEWLASERPACRAALDPALVRTWTIEAAAPR